MKKRVIIIFLLFYSAFCLGQDKIDKIRNSAWINVDYIRQMENRLPCQCADSVNYSYYITISPTTINKEIIAENDFIIPEIIINNIIQTEGGCEYEIIYKDSAKYIISGCNELTYELIISDDTLLLTDSRGSKKFIKSTLEFTDDMEYLTGDWSNMDNIILLNKSLIARGHPALQTTLKEQKLLLECNAWLDTINMVYGKKKSWVLEIIDGYLFIRQVVKKRRDPLDPVKTKVIKVFKWNMNSKNSIPKHKKNKVFYDNIQWTKPTNANF